MKVRKEVFESLRLELQEFVPQEFVAGCYDITLGCSSSGEYAVVVVGGTSYSHSGGPHSKTLTIQSPDEPTLSYIANKVSSVSSATAGKNNGHKTDYKGYAWNNSGWHFITDFNYSINADPNVS